MSGKNSAATERAISRHQLHGQSIRSSAKAEGIDPGTLFRALARMREGAPGERTLVAGAGALGREVASWLRRWNGVSISFLDDAFLTGAAADLDLRGIVGALSADAIGPADKVLVAIADPAARARIVVEVFAGKKLGRYIDPTSVIAQAEIGEGCLLLPFTLVSDRTTIGRHTIINTHSAIGHDCTVGEFCTLSSYVCLCGGVEVGDGVTFGVGAKVLPKVKIGDGATIGAGAVVVRDVAAGVTVFGNPAREISA